MLIVVALAADARAENDPSLEWWTIETKHFRITYEKNLEPIAERIARLGESIYQRLVGPLGYVPAEHTEILLTDFTDSANGSANSVPYNQVRLYVTAPSDLSPLHDYGDWYLGLLTHEYTHVLHTDNVSGVPAVFNTIFGKTLSPNQAQPHWFLEGLAVVAESEYTSGGRIRSSLFDAWLRADVLDGRLAGLDQFSNDAQRWPQGHLWYLYGSRFLHWITEVYGKDVLRAVSNDYGATVVPFGINRAIRRQTGRTYVELYDGFRDYLERSYGKQMREVRRRGLREGRRITFHGRTASYPLFVPDRGRYAPDAGGYQIAYFRDDLNTRSGIYLLRLPKDGAPAGEVKGELVARSSFETPASYAPNGDLYYSSLVPYKVIYNKSELFRVPAGLRAPDGGESYRMQLTKASRATAPAVSPDGDKVVFTVNERGTTWLDVADVRHDGSLARIRPLVRPERRFDQAYTPAYSPDGKRLAYSVWRAGGWRDVRILELDTGAVTEVTHDRALDVEPAWSPDGSRLFFSSDRSGIFNIYEYRLDSGALRQVTNVRNMAVMPAVSPDGKLLAYSGYSSYGYDIWVMPLDESRYLDAPPPPADRPEEYADPPAVPYQRHRYNPLPTLRPHNYFFSYAPGNVGGNAFTLTASGEDIAAHHDIALSMVADPKAPLPQLAFDYSYGRLPFDLGLHFGNRVTPRTDYVIGGVAPPYLEKSYSVRASLSYRRPGEFANQSFGLSYTASVLDSTLPVAGLVLDPNAEPTQQPRRGFLGTVHLGYGIGRIEGGLDTPGPSRGYALNVGLDVSDKATGSDESLYQVNYTAVGYIPMPWYGHHVLALRSGGGMTMGSFARRGVFYVGGYNLDNTSLLDTITAGTFNGAFVLRGYPASSYRGSSYLLQTMEYRFPLAVPDAGLSTLPLYLRRIDGNLFLDYGGAFDDFDFRAVKFFSKGAIIDSPDLHTSVGGELWLGTTLGYILDLNLRLGYAFGFSAERIPGGQLYFLAASAF